MKTFAEIESAANHLAPSEKAKLVRCLSPKPSSGGVQARTIRLGTDCLLEAPEGARPMTPENIKQLLEDSP